MSKRIGIWIRVSTEDQAKGESPQTHEHRARLYAEMKGWEVATVYHLEGVSGSVAMEHAEAKRMRKDVVAGRIDALIFSKLARLARDTKSLLEVADFFKEYEADLVSLGESIDTSSPAGRFFYTILAAMAAWEREETIDRLKASIKTRAKAGKSLGGRAPLGFRWENKRLVPDEKEAPIVRTLFETFIRERRFSSTAEKLNEAGLRTRRGKKFSDASVKRLIQNTVMKGVFVQNYTQSRGDGKGWDLKPEEEWEHTEVEAIVPHEIFEQANVIAKEICVGPIKRGRKSKHLFSGLVVCSACETKMYVPSNSPKYICRSCRRKIRKDDLEEVFLSRLKQFLLSEKEVTAYVSDAHERLEERRQLLQTLRREKGRVEQDMRDLFLLYQEKGLTVGQFKRRNEPLEERLAALGDEIPRTEGAITFLEVEAQGSEDIVSGGTLLVDGWKEIPKEERRIIIEHLVKQVVITEDEVILTLRRPPKDPNSPPSGGNDNFSTKANAVEAAALANRDRITRFLEAKLEQMGVLSEQPVDPDVIVDTLPDGEVLAATRRLADPDRPRVPDLDNLQLFAGWMVRLSLEQMRLADRQTEAERHDDLDPRSQRDEAAVHAYRTLLNVRRVVQGALGDAGVVRYLAIEGTLAQNPLGIANQLEDTIERLTSREVELPEVEVDWMALDWDRLVASLREALEPLRGAIREIDRQQRNADLAVIAKEEALQAFQDDYVGWSHVLRGVYIAAAQRELASRLSPTDPTRSGGGDGEPANDDAPDVPGEEVPVVEPDLSDEPVVANDPEPVEATGEVRGDDVA